MFGSNIFLAKVRDHQKYMVGKKLYALFFFRWNMIRDVPNFEFGSKKVRGFLGSVRAFQGPIYLEPNFLKTLILSVFESFCSFLFSSIFD